MHSARKHSRNQVGTAGLSREIDAAGRQLNFSGAEREREGARKHTSELTTHLHAAAEVPVGHVLLAGQADQPRQTSGPRPTLSDARVERAYLWRRQCTARWKDAGANDANRLHSKHRRASRTRPAASTSLRRARQSRHTTTRHSRSSRHPGTPPATAPHTAGRSLQNRQAGSALGIIGSPPPGANARGAKPSPQHACPGTRPAAAQSSSCTRAAGGGSPNRGRFRVGVAILSLFPLDGLLTSSCGS